MSGTVVWFDLETGGVEPQHPNIQIAAVAMRDGVEVCVFERKIMFAEDECEFEALKINGYKPENWASAIPEGRAMAEFSAFLRQNADTTLVSPKTGNPYNVAMIGGHNVTTFDIPRLKAAMQRARIGFWPGCWWYPLDTYQRSIWHFHERQIQAPKNYQLQTLAAHFEIPAQGAAHEALADVRLCARLAAAMEFYLVAPPPKDATDPNVQITTVARAEHLSVDDEVWLDGGWKIVVAKSPSPTEGIVVDTLVDDSGGVNGEEESYDDECFLARRCKSLGVGIG